ncbi:hypothetical protein ACQR18_30285 [Bradyrhizobium oligotrophicum]|uniref:hypothetical protein n=1 Tax=Bradyrhizobium oligotrophicum TaxID=44255 RepID=UPI003EBA8807
MIAPVTCATRQVGIRLGASIGAPGPHGLNVRKPPVVHRRLTAIAPRTPRIVTTRTPLSDEAGWRIKTRFLKKGKKKNSIAYTTKLKVNIELDLED